MKENRKNQALWKAILMAALVLVCAGMVNLSQTREVKAAPEGFVTENGKTYYYHNGQKVKGWLNLNGKMYYFTTGQGVQMKGWARNKQGQYRYFTKGSGEMLTGFAVNSKNQYRYFTKGKGIMLTGWAQTQKGERRYFYSRSGIMAMGRLVNAKGQERWFRTDNGIMVTGWMLTGEYQWVYFREDSGTKCFDQWIGDRYVQADGTMAVNTVTPDGSYVGPDGIRQDAQERNLTDLKNQLVSMIQNYGGNWSVYVKDLNTGGVININDSSMYPASVIKLFVMASTYDQINKGALARTSYVNNLLWEMITVSDNEAYNELVRLNGWDGRFTTGASVVNQYLYSQGLTGTECHSTLHPSSSSFTSDGGRNMASARDAGVLLEKIWRGECVSLDYSREMLNLLFHQERRWKIPAGIPSWVPVANKTGETDSSQHDVAIVDGPKTDYIVCIFSQGVWSNGSRIANLSSVIYQYLNG